MGAGDPGLDTRDPTVSYCTLLVPSDLQSAETVATLAIVLAAGNPAVLLRL